jgi:hypothetical protein
VKIGWGNEHPFCRVATTPSEFASQNLLFRDDGAQIATLPGDGYNGYISVYVVNDLTVPNSTVATTLEVNTFVSMCDDFDVAAPTEEALRNLSWFKDEALSAQSGVEQADTENTAEPSAPMQSENQTQLAAELSPQDHTFDVFFGESVTSIRQVLKRYCIHENLSTLNVASAYVFTNLIRNVFPFHRGYDPNGSYSIAAGPYSASNMTMLNWFMPGFTGWRGAIRWKVLQMGITNGQNGQLYMKRLDNSFGPSFTNSIVETGSLYARAAQSRLRIGDTIAGASIQNNRYNNVIESEIPFFRNARFRFCKRLDQLAPGSLNDIGWACICKFFNNDSTDVDLQTYCASGEDFSLFFFTGAPIVYSVPDPAN